MPIFEYKGLNRAGKNVRGIIDSDNLRNARTKLKKDGIFVTTISDKQKTTQSNNKKRRGGGATGKSVNVRDLSLMTRQLATDRKSVV